MFCEENLPISLCSSILFFIAVSLENIQLVIGLLLVMFLSNVSVHSYSIDLEKDLEEKKDLDKHKIAIKQKYKCANFASDYKCLLEDGVFDESGYKMLDSKVYCPMCFSVNKRKNKTK
jgi:hypothetical protein